MKLFLSGRELRRRQNRFLVLFFTVMGILAVLFALLMLGRVVMERLPWP
jgi:ABC-type transporter Mla subunit MlaD